jgi:hypothetical protein
MTRGSPEPSQKGGKIRSCRTRGAPEPSLRVRSHGTHGDVEAHLGWEAGPRAAGHMVAPAPTSAGRLDLVLLDTWRHVCARLAPCLDLKLVPLVTRTAAYRQ